jgi:hypothetical protein
MAGLVIVGDRKYIDRMYKHLLKEHPTTRGKMFIKNK